MAILPLLLYTATLLLAGSSVHGRRAGCHSDHEERRNNRPIVGILSQAGLDEDTFVAKDGTYIASSYIKFVESGGARVVPILADMPADKLEGLLGRLNGFLIPGGAANLRPGHDFYDTARRVLDYALRANDRGEYFPVMGICLGFETLMILTAGSHDILRPYQSDGMAAQLYFTADAPTSRFFSSWDLDLVWDVMQTPLTRESHSNGVSMSVFMTNQKLQDFFKPLSLSLDKEGRVYISSIEAKDYPIVGLQWHPEKNTFEWTKHKSIPHGYWSTEVTHQAARFFINETRRSLHAFDDVVDEDVWLIYNDKQVFAGKHIKVDDPVWAEQAVVFPAWERYTQQLEDRAEEAGRNWLDSIKLDSTADQAAAAAVAGAAVADSADGKPAGAADALRKNRKWMSAGGPGRAAQAAVAAA